MQNRMVTGWIGRNKFPPSRMNYVKDTSIYEEKTEPSDPYPLSDHHSCPLSSPYVLHPNGNKRKKKMFLIVQQK